VFHENNTRCSIKKLCGETGRKVNKYQWQKKKIKNNNITRIKLKEKVSFFRICK